MNEAELSDDGRMLNVRVPIGVSKRGGRKIIVAPEDDCWPRSQSQLNTALVKALARAFRWRKLIETGRFATVSDLADAELVSASYVARILRLTLLAPEVVESVLDLRLPKELTVAAVMRPIPVHWGKQRASLVE